jgi:hypothetical protein
MLKVSFFYYYFIQCRDYSEFLSKYLISMDRSTTDIFYDIIFINLYVTHTSKFIHKIKKRMNYAMKYSILVNKTNYPKKD